MRNGLLVVVALAIGCNVDPANPGDGGQFGEENRGCQEVSRTPVSLDDATLGFDAQSILDLGGAHATTLEYAGGDSTDLAIEVTQTPDGAVELVTYVYIDDSGAEIAMADCGPQLELEVEVSFGTGDGVFDEHWSDLLVAPAADTAYVFEDLTEVNGTFDAWDYAPEENDFDEMAASIDFALTPAGPVGEVMAVGTGSDGEGDDGTVFAEAILIGTFGEEGEEEIDTDGDDE